jgi:hypothetical protein
MMAIFPDIVPNLLALGPIDKCFLKPLYDLFHVLIERFFGAIVIDEVLDNVARELVNTGVDGVSFVDDLPFKNNFTLFIHLIIPDSAIANSCLWFYQISGAWAILAVASTLYPLSPTLFFEGGR